MMTKKILLLMCHWVGDTFWAMQLLPELKRVYPNAELWVGVKPFSKDLFYNLVDEDKIIILKYVTSDRHREKFSLLGYLDDLRKTRQQKFDMAIDLTINRYSTLFLALAGIKQRIGLDTHKLSFLYTKRGGKFECKRHLSERPWEVLKVINSQVQKPIYPFPPNGQIGQRELEEKIRISLSEKIALISPGAGWLEKQWGIDNFAECGKFLMKNGYKVIISGTEKERPLCEELNSKLNGKAILFIEPLGCFISLIPYLSLAITNDNGAAHIIAATQVKIITLFLDTENTRCAPLGKNVILIDESKAVVETVIEKIRSLL